MKSTQRKPAEGSIEHRDSRDRIRITVAFVSMAFKLKENDLVKKVEGHTAHDVHLFIFTEDKVIQVQGYPGLSKYTDGSICISIYEMDKNKFLKARESKNVSIGNEGHLAGQKILVAARSYNVEEVEAVINKYLPKPRKTIGAVNLYGAVGKNPRNPRRLMARITLRKLNDGERRLNIWEVGPHVGPVVSADLTKQ